MYTHTYIHTCLGVCIYIYTYIEREREKIYVYIYICVCIYVHMRVYIYIYIIVLYITDITKYIKYREKYIERDMYVCYVSVITMLSCLL